MVVVNRNNNKRVLSESIISPELLSVPAAESLQKMEQILKSFERVTHAECKKKELRCKIGFLISIWRENAVFFLIQILRQIAINLRLLREI